MKKLFIQCVVLVMCICIFAPIFVFAQAKQVTPRTWKNKDGETVQAYEVIYKTGGSALIYKSPSDKEWTVDAYILGKKENLESTSSYTEGIQIGAEYMDEISGTKDQITDGGSLLPDPVGALKNDIKAGLDSTAEKILSGVKEFILNVLWTISKLIAWVTGLVGKLFDMIIIQLTPTSKEVWEIKIQDSILAAWKIIRDVASIIIIFSLLYLGIKTILDGQGFADKKTLISIIVAAILLNFSLLFTRDIAFHISNKIGYEILQTAILSSQSGDNSFSGAMLGMIGPQRLFSENGGLENFNAQSMSGDTWTQIGMFAMQTVILSFVLLVAVFIFVALIITLIIRFIVFVILMITAPLGIIAFTIPWLKHHGQTWWSELKKQTIFFPAFVFIMYIIFLIIGTIGGPAVLDLAVNDSVVQSAAAFFLNFALIIGFLIVLLIAPFKLSEGGSSLVNKATNWSNKKIRSYAGNAAFGTSAMLGRNTVGRLGAYALSSDKLKSAAQNAKGFKGTAARALLRGSDKAQNASFDARATKAGGKLAATYGLGTASKGWKGTIDEKKKAYKEQMEKEKKLYGFGEMNDAQKAEHTNKLNTARADRDNLAKEVEDERKKLAQTRKNNPSDTAAINLISESLAKKEKELGKFETEVGKLMQAGDSSYIKYLKDQRHRGLNVYKRMSRTQKLALEALEKDMNKEWQAAGKAKPVKQNKPTTPTQATTVTISGSSSTPPPISSTSSTSSGSSSSSTSSGSSTH